MRMRLISERIQRLVDSTSAGASLRLALWRQSSGFPDDKSGRNRLGALTLEFCSIQGNLSQSRWIWNCDPDDSALFDRPLESLSIIELDRLDRLIHQSKLLVIQRYRNVIPWPSDDIAHWYQAPLRSELRSEWGYRGPMTSAMITFVSCNPNHAPYLINVE